MEQFTTTLGQVVGVQGVQWEADGHDLERQVQKTAKPTVGEVGEGGMYM